MDSSEPLALTLTVRNAVALDNGSPLSFVVDRRSASIGRAASTDWPLPDPERHISSRHAEVAFAGGGYEIVDKSTNGTFVNNEAQRLSAPYRVRDGDLIRIGKYEIIASLTPSAASGSGPSATPVPAAPPPPPPPAAAPTPVSPAPEPQDSAELAAAEKRERLWTTFELSNAVDWSRGGFASTPQASPAAEPASTPEQPGDDNQQPATADAADTADAGLGLLLKGAELDRGQIRQDAAAALTQAGMLLRRLIAGMVVMLEARARAKSQMGAQSTGLEIAGNNPLKFARNPEQALAYLLNPQERGFMPADRAIEDSFRDLQAHQLATLRAMQGALRSTLDRFSPKSIRSRAENRGLLARILPSTRDAALWKAYEKEFSGVAFDSDEAFMDIFAKEFRQAYDQIARES